MDDFTFKDGKLYCEDVDARSLAERFGTPLFVYSKRTLLDHYARFQQAFSRHNARVCFSVKSCQNLSILRLLREAGSSFDIVSGGELSRVLEVGVDSERIVFAGVGKSDEEIERALDAGIGWFNVESEAELENIAQLAMGRGAIARIALRINPDVDPHTHEYTTTGKRATKFGIDLDLAAKVFDDFRGRRGIKLDGIHLHIGSPVNRIEPYRLAISKALRFIEELRGLGHDIRALNIGGGFGAHYDGSEAPTASEYADAIIPLLEDRHLDLLLEPGRCIAANAGILLTKTLYKKSSGARHFLIVDAAITELIRPALYGAFHFAWPVSPPPGMIPSARSADLTLDGTEQVDIVGPVCESSDFLAKDRNLPPMKRGDYLAVFSTGAYGFSMSSQYNSRLRAAEVLVDGEAVELIRRRETYDDLVAPERLYNS